MMDSSSSRSLPSAASPPAPLVTRLELELLAVPSDGGRRLERLPPSPALRLKVACLIMRRPLPPLASPDGADKLADDAVEVEDEARGPSPSSGPLLWPWLVLEMPEPTVPRLRFELGVAKMSSATSPCPSLFSSSSSPSSAWSSS